MKEDTGVCYIIDENGYIMFISEQDGVDRLVRSLQRIVHV